MFGNVFDAKSMIKMLMAFLTQKNITNSVEGLLLWINEKQKGYGQKLVAVLEMTDSGNDGIITLYLRDHTTRELTPLKTIYINQITSEQLKELLNGITGK